MTFVQLLQALGRSAKPWFTVKPWEQAVRVRRGKRAQLLGPGMHWKWWIIDTATVYEIRLRTEYAPLQTLTSKDGQTLLLGLVIEYRIDDLMRVLDTLHNAEGTLIHKAQTAVARFVRAHDAGTITPDALTAYALETIQPTQFGVGAFSLGISDSADLSRRTFRLLNDGRWGNTATETTRMGREG